MQSDSKSKRYRVSGRYRVRDIRVRVLLIGVKDSVRQPLTLRSAIKLMVKILPK